jgi:hypothetical protein
MNQRGISTLASVIGAALLGLVAATFMMDWVVVDVDVPEDNVRIVAPVPLFLADVALSFAPEDAFDQAEVPPELAAQRDAILAGLEELLQLENATLVSVTTPDETVDLSVDDGELRIMVDAEDARVRCTLPLDGIHATLERWDWKTVDPRMALDVLHAAKSGTLVHVEAEDGVRVTIDMW